MTDLATWSFVVGIVNLVLAVLALVLAVLALVVPGNTLIPTLKNWWASRSAKRLRNRIKELEGWLAHVNEPDHLEHLEDLRAEVLNRAIRAGLSLSMALLMAVGFVGLSLFALQTLLLSLRPNWFLLNAVGFLMLVQAVLGMWDGLWAARHCRCLSPVVRKRATGEATRQIAALKNKLESKNGTTLSKKP